MYRKKIILYVCLMMVTFIFAGFTSKVPKTYEMDKRPIIISGIQIQPMINGKTEVRGSVTNNGKYNCNMCVRVTYKNSDGSLLYIQDIQIVDLYVGNTIYYSNFIKNIDISNATYKVSFAHFFTY